jgi:hypothetical protein
MKQPIKLCAAVLALVLLLSSIPFHTFAVMGEDTVGTTSENARSMFNDPCIYDSAGNQYGIGVWKSFAEAKNYYGASRTYSRCSINYAGNYYNYYYTYDSGLRMYFSVREK